MKQFNLLLFLWLCLTNWSVFAYRHGSLPPCNKYTIFQGKWKYFNISAHAYNMTNKINRTHIDDIEEAYNQCPDTLTLIQSHIFLQHQVQYACHAEQTQAVWVPSNCRIMSPHQSLLHIYNINDKSAAAAIAKTSAASSILAASQRRRQLHTTEQHSNINNSVSISSSSTSRPNMAPRRGEGIYHSSIMPTGHPKINITVLGDSISGQLFIAMHCLLASRNLLDFVNMNYNLELLYRRDIPCVHNCTLPGESGSTFRAMAASNIILFL